MQYHNMVDVIKIFIRFELPVDYNGHLSCLLIKMFDIFAAAGHHKYVNGARLCCQLMKDLEDLPAYKKTFFQLPMGTTFSVIPAMNGPVLGVTSALSRH